MANITEERPKAKSLRPLRALVPYLRPHWRVLAAALGALLVAAAAQLALPIALRSLIDEGLAVRDAATINRYFVAFLAAAVVFGAFAALRFYLVSWLGERVVADMRNAVYANVDSDGPELLRGHAHGRGAVAPHGRHHARAVDLGRRHLDLAALDAHAARLARAARGDEPDAHLDDRRRDAADRRRRC